MAEIKKPTPLYQFFVLLRSINPVVWRRLLLRSDRTIADLHYGSRDRCEKGKTPLFSTLFPNYSGNLSIDTREVVLVNTRLIWTANDCVNIHYKQMNEFNAFLMSLI
jgi:hypothetical protein